LKKTSFNSNGKLLITGEYLVLEGALSLAVPTIPGQKLIFGQGLESGIISWKSYFEDTCWFEGRFTIKGIDIIDANDAKAASYLQSILQEAHRLNPEFLRERQSLTISTHLGFKQNWGLGSSSSLINNIAEGFTVDPFELFFNTHKGSGYDIACAKSDSPIFYRLENTIPQIEKVDFKPSFQDSIAFVYSGKKQDSETSVNHFLGKNGFYEYEKGSISEISRDIIKATNLSEFNELLNEHEDIMASVLQLPKVKELRFPDFPGSIKSLGAWGGDFLLASSKIGFDEIKTYFHNHDLKVIFSYDQLVLNASH
jgi:mevalonate kinase